jgi:hypothetical protein
MNRMNQSPSIGIIITFSQFVFIISFQRQTGLNQQNNYYCGKDKYYVDEEHLCTYTPRSVVGVEWNDDRKRSKAMDG